MTIFILPVVTNTFNRPRHRPPGLRGSVWNRKCSCGWDATVAEELSSSFMSWCADCSLWHENISGIQMGEIYFFLPLWAIWPTLLAFFFMQLCFVITNLLRLRKRRSRLLFVCLFLPWHCQYSCKPKQSILPKISFLNLYGFQIHKP